MVEALALPARLLLGIVFLIAGLGKLLEARAVSENTVEYALLPPRLARLHGRLLPWLELVTALLLLSGPFLSPHSPLRTAPFFLAGGLLAAFSLAVAVTLARGVSAECHCFGRFGGGRVTRWTLGRNLLLGIAVLGAAGARGGTLTLTSQTARPSLGPLVLLALAALAVALMAAEMWGLARPRRTPAARPQSVVKE